jgi:hypothetical protein
MAAGAQLGRQRTMAALAQLLEQGTFRLVSAEGKPVSTSELSRALGVTPGRQTLAGTKLIALALTVACVTGLLTFLLVRFAH